MFGPPADVGLDPGGFQFQAQVAHHIIDVLLAIQPALVQQLGDLFVLLGLQVAERQVFQLPLDMADAQAMGQRRIDVEDFAGHALTLRVVGMLDRADRTGALGQLDQGDAHVIDHRHQHPAQVLHLGLGAEHQGVARVEAGTDRRHAQHTVDQLGHHRAEALVHGGQGHLALAYAAVNDGGDQRILVELEVGENLRDLEAGTEAGGAFRPQVLCCIGLLLGLASELAGPQQGVVFERRIDAEHMGQPGL
ncbi:hypothetical protein D3C85_749530 [compost metagenome]